MEKLKFNKKLEQDIKKYSSMAGAIVGVASVAQGQIVYTDVNPDEVIAVGDNFIIDFNQDNDEDVAVGGWAYSSPGYYNLKAMYAYGFGTSDRVLAYDKIVTAGPYTDTLELVSALNQNDVIDQNRNWDFSGGYLCDVGTYYANPINEGAFNGQGDKFLGVRFQLSGQDHYGWVRLNVANDCGQVTVKDFAYNSTPGAPILAGQTSGGVGITNPEVLEGVSAYSFNKSLFISMKDFKEGLTVDIYNMLGAKIYNGDVNGNRQEVRLNDFAEGAYIAIVRSSEGKIYQKKFQLN